MSTKYRIAAVVAAALFGFGAAALAQSPAIPKVSIINPSDLMAIVPNGSPSARTYFANPNQITSQSGYQKLSPVTGFTYTFNNTDSVIVLTNSGTVSAGTITFAAAPSDGSQECLFAQNTITTLHLTANTGQTGNNLVTTLGAASKVCYLYSLSNATWDRD